MPRTLLLLLLLSASRLMSATWSTGSPSTTNNDDSCDISVAPAATLLLPYFEVDVGGKPETARTTVISVINVSPLPQIARVTVWTDWAYPVITFSIVLTGYDVEAVDLRDMIMRGVIPTRVDARGPMSLGNFGNPNHAATVAQDCGRRMPHVPVGVLNDIRALLTRGKSSGAALSCPVAEGEAQLGGDHGPATAAGYVTIDVVATCAPTLPTSTSYYTSELLFDNVLTGDYVSVRPSGAMNGYAGGSPLVHIRAVPEGGPAGSIVNTRLPFTFYDRFTPMDATMSHTIDRRQPLPSVFAARWISGTKSDFQTTYVIWREAVTAGTAACGDYVQNSAMPAAEIVRFDEHENASTNIATFSSATANAAIQSTTFPAIVSQDAGGWLYMNLNNGGSQRYSASRAGYGAGIVRATAYPRNVSQNWVTVNLFAEDRYGVNYDAAWLSNGCTPAAVSTKRQRIGLTGKSNP
ncbi:MAG TPA: hypothetical protein VLV78_02040 [Thermoanaerobaculia bacterium]|nr:hypothetical protein [Thermoanaerobaculia bacterium]